MSFAAIIRITVFLHRLIKIKQQIIHKAKTKNKWISLKDT